MARQRVPSVRPCPFHLPTHAHAGSHPERPSHQCGKQRHHVQTDHDHVRSHHARAHHGLGVRPTGANPEPRPRPVKPAAERYRLAGSRDEYALGIQQET